MVLGARFEAVPDVWRLDLVGDHRLVLYADNLEVRKGEHVFTLSVRGDGPPLPVARISSRLVGGVRREPVEPSVAERTQPEDQ